MQRVKGCNGIFTFKRGRFYWFTKVQRMILAFIIFLGSVFATLTLCASKQFRFLRVLAKSV